MWPSSWTAGARFPTKPFTGWRRGSKTRPASRPSRSSSSLANWRPDLRSRGRCARGRSSLSEIEEAETWLASAKVAFGQDASGRARYTVVVAQCIHALIRANDALTVRLLRRRSTRHEDAALLFGELVRLKKIPARFSNLRALLVRAVSEKVGIRLQGNRGQPRRCGPLDAPDGAVRGRGPRDSSMKAFRARRASSGPCAEPAPDRASVRSIGVLSPNVWAASRQSATGRIKSSRPRGRGLR